MTSTIPTHIERTKNRSSRAILRDGLIRIRLAYGLSLAEEERHIRTLVERMKSAAQRMAKKTVIHPFQALLEGAADAVITPVIGPRLHFKVSLTESKTHAHHDEDGWKIFRNRKSAEPSFHRFLWKLLSLSLIETAEELVRKTNDETLRENMKKVRLRFTASRWGSCSMGGTISLSTPLFFTSQEVLQYVIIHELAHIRHPNHSQAFWRCVETTMPDYKKKVKELSGFSLPSLRKTKN